MSTIPEHLLEPLDFAANELKGLLNPKLDEDERMVQKGLLLFRQGLVSQDRFDQNNVSGIVQDVMPAKVLLDLDFINLSECSCPADGFCRHQLAVFFYLLSQAKSVTEWVDQWRQPVKETKTVQLLGIQRAKDLLSSSSRQKPDYDNWVASIQESFDTIMTGNGEPKPYYMNELYQIYEKRWKANAPFEQEWKHLYYLIGYFFSFKKLMELSFSLGHTGIIINQYYYHLYQDLLEDILEETDKLSVHSLPFAFDEFIEKFKEDSTDILTYESDLEYEQIQLYRLLWTKFFRKKAWCQKEVEKLLSIEDKKYPVVVAIIHQYVLLGRDEDALQLLGVPDKWLTPYFINWIEYLTFQKEWKRVGPYIEEFIKKLQEYLRSENYYYKSKNFTSLVMKIIKPYCTETDRLDLYEKALAEMLPFSFSEYEYTLFENGEFSRWIDLHALMISDIDVLPKSRIKEIEKSEPSLLLPLYHQSVQRHIEHKGRDHYRAAVRKLKKLRTLYKKLKRQDDWTFFLEALLEKTKRLRAFQEECKRGKLIDA
ncbi:SWIM zinc finger domain-containing protein [Bacillus sp. S/N-304-OC-R1]|uniref:SWIM zinc finger family protein n=1 Tax=Bacillus sp. S/N-304-OC-R1 TaxID=2758034 RepID=UPI001C8DAF57|nr:SWIM zinc finger family protein [Bacillus sp. S/N-304-OC-R1]MBY0122282.1 SWIM zinc finger family protein [Bacillus sp. S/N-304-OC-R1]